MSTGTELVGVEASEEKLRIIKLEVHEKLRDIVDSVSKDVDKPNQRLIDLLGKSSDVELRPVTVLSDCKDKSAVTDDDGQQLVLVQNNCDKTSELQKMLARSNSDMSSSKKELFDTLNLCSSPSTSVLNENKCENINLASLASDHGYSLKESQLNKGKKNGDLKIQDIAASLLLLSDKKQSKKRKEFESRNENDANPNNTDGTTPKRRRFPHYPQRPANLSAKCLEPFNTGWKRELVHRKLLPTEAKIHSDVYYISPTGIKLRSYRDVAEYLKETNEPGLSLDCFTYKRVLIYHPPEEIERNAGEVGSRRHSFRRRRESGNSVKSTSSSNASKSSPQFLKKSPAVGKVKKVRNTTQQPNANPKRRLKLGSVPCSLACPGQQGILPSLQCEVCLCMFHPQCVNISMDITSFTCIKCTYRKHYGTDKRVKSPTHSMEIPHIQATADLRNVDDDCESPVAVEVRSSMIANNLTVKKIQIAPTFHVLPRLTAAPKGSQSVLNRKDEMDKRNPPPLKLSPFALSQPITQIRSEGTWTPPPVPPRTIALNKPPGPPPLKMVAMKVTDPQQQLNGSQGVIRQPPPLKTMSPVSPPQSRLMMVPISVPPINSIIRTKGGNVLWSADATTTVPVPSSPTAKPVLTAATDTKSGEKSAQKPGVVTMINNMSINNVMMNNVGTMKFSLKTSNGNVTEVLVPEIKPTNAASPPQPKYIVTDKFGKPNGLVVGFGNSVIQLPILNKLDTYRHETSDGTISVPVPHPSTSILVPKLVKSDAPTERKCEDEELNKEENSCDQTKSKVLESKETTVKANCNTADDKAIKVDKQDPMIRNIQHYFARPTVLLRVFEHLTHDDLSRVRCVNRSWKWWASQPDLWKSIDLSGTCVYDWNKLAELIKQFKSTRLDMRKMNVFEDQNRTWHCFISVLKDLETIEHIDFGNIPGAFLTPITRSLNRLKVLTAEMIVEYSNNNCRLDIGIFGKLEHLIKLRLKGVSGLQLQNILTEGLASLSNLKHLVHLSITTIRDAPASDFEVIKSLKQLKELELGDCKNWESETYSYLSELTELNKLRLEVGTAFPDNFSHSSISRLNKLIYLELNDYKINANLIPVLKHLPQLEHLIIIPNCKQNSEITNTIIYEGLQGLQSLKVLEWKILTITSSQRSSAKSDTNCDTTDSEDEVVVIDPSCESKNEKVIIQEDDACIPIVVDGDDKCLTIDELWDKVKDICSNVIFH